LIECIRKEGKYTEENCLGKVSSRSPLRTRTLNGPGQGLGRPGLESHRHRSGAMWHGLTALHAAQPAAVVAPARASGDATCDILGVYDPHAFPAAAGAVSFHVLAVAGGAVHATADIGNVVSIDHWRATYTIQLATSALLVEEATVKVVFGD
jgi:hypothetical protein